MVRMESGESGLDVASQGSQQVTQPPLPPAATAAAATVGPQEPASYQDSGYAWVVLLAAFCLHVISLGNVYSFGVFVDTAIYNYNASAAQIESIGSVQETSFFLAGEIIVREIWQWETY